MAEIQNLLGKRYGRLVVIKRAKNRGAKNNQTYWLCQCDCGKQKEIASYSLKHGISKSCGCLQKERASQVNSKHGYTVDRGKERLYCVWCTMRERCYSPKNKSYPDYGGRGIKVCDEWKEYTNFRDWALANGYDEKAPRGVCSLDRINTDGNYEPNNCRWANQKTQQRNKRNTLYVEWKGKKRPLAEWAEILNVKYHTLWVDINKKGLSFEDAIKKECEQL